MSDEIVSTGKFSPADVDNALTAYAVHGNFAEVERILKDEFDLSVSTPTISRWVKSQYRERFLEISNRYADQVRVELAAAHERVARKAIDGADFAAEELLARLKRDRNSLPPHELGLALKHFSASAGSHQKASDVLRGRPTEIRENRSPEEFIDRKSVV